MSFTLAVISKDTLSSETTQMTLFKLIMLTFGIGSLVLSWVMVPETLVVSIVTCEKEARDRVKKKKTTRYLIWCFKSLKVIKQPKIFCSLPYNYKKINK